MSNSSTPTARTRVIREPQRAVYDRDAAYQILDEGFICHVGFAVDGQPYVIPTSYARHNDLLYIHGSAASRMLCQASSGIPVCVTVTLLDGLVLARSIFNHSMNYRPWSCWGKQLLLKIAPKSWPRCKPFPNTSCPAAGKTHASPTSRN